MSSAGNAQFHRDIQDEGNVVQRWMRTVDEGKAILKGVSCGPFPNDPSKGSAVYTFMFVGDDKNRYRPEIFGAYQPIEKLVKAHRDIYLNGQPAQPHPVHFQQDESAQFQPGAQAEISGSIAQVAQMQAASAQVQGSAQAEANGKRKALELDDQMDLDMAVDGPSHQKDDGVVPSTPVSKSNRKVRQRQNHPDDEPSSGPSTSPLHTQDQHQSGGLGSSSSSNHNRQLSAPTRRSSRVNRSSSSSSVASTSNIGQQQGSNTSSTGNFASTSAIPYSAPQQDQPMNDVGPSTSGATSKPAVIRKPSVAPARCAGHRSEFGVSKDAAPSLPRGLHLNTYHHQQEQEQQRLAPSTSAPRAVDFRTFAPPAPGSVWGGIQDGRSNYASSVADSIGSDGTVTQSVYNANQARAGQISDEITDLMINHPDHMDISK